MFTAICKRIGVWVVQKGRLYLLLGVLCLLGSVTLTANAILTVSNSGMFGDADVTVDSAGTLNVGTASSTAVVIGKTGTPVTIPGNVAINGALTLGSASTTGQLLFHIASSSFTTLLQASSSQASNLTFTLPTTAGTAGQAMLTDGAGNLFFGNTSSSQWLNGTLGTISYSAGGIGINTTTPLALLSIVGSATSTAPLFDIASSSGTSLFRVSPDGTVTVGTMVLGTCAGVDDTAMMQGMLNTGGQISIGGSSCKINTTLTVGSNTKLSLTPATVVSFKAGVTGGNMLQNSAVTPLRSNTTCSISIGTATLTCTDGTFTSADVGRTEIVQTAGGGSQYVLVANIISITSGTVVVLSSPAVSTATSVAAALYNRDTNIEVSGGTWNRGPVGGSPETTAAIFFFRHVDGLNTHDIQFASTNGTIANWAGDVTRVTATNQTFNTRMDGVHITGPAAYVSVANITGTTHDDSVAIVGAEYPGFNDVGGNISNVVVQGVSASSSTETLRLIGGTGVTLRDITLRDITALGTTYAVAITNDSQEGSATDIAGVLVDGVSGRAAPILVYLNALYGTGVIIKNVQISDPTTQIAINVAGGTWGTITVDGVTHSTEVGGALGVMSVASGASIASLALSNISVSPSSGSSGVLTVGGTVGNLVLDKVSATPSSINGHTNIVQINGGSVTHLSITNTSLVAIDTTASTMVELNGGSMTAYEISNSRQYKGGQVLWFISGTSGLGKMSNMDVNAVGRLAVLLGPAVDLTLSDLSLTSPVSAAIYTSGGAVTIRGSGVNRATAWAGFERAGSEVIHCINEDYPADVSLLTRAMGDRAYNTNASLGTLGAAGPVVSDATAWHLMSNPSLVY
jgi:hypothetical protein